MQTVQRVAEPRRISVNPKITLGKRVRRMLRRWLLPVTCAVQIINYAVRQPAAALALHTTHGTCVCVGVG